MLVSLRALKWYKAIVQCPTILNFNLIIFITASLPRRKWLTLRWTYNRRERYCSEPCPRALCYYLAAFAESRATIKGLKNELLFHFLRSQWCDPLEVPTGMHKSEWHKKCNFNPQLVCVCVCANVHEPPPPHTHRHTLVNNKGWFLNNQHRRE